MIPEGEVGCKFCDKSIYRIFVEHIEEHTSKKNFVISEDDVELLRYWWRRHDDDIRTIDKREYGILDKILTLIERHFK